MLQHKNHKALCESLTYIKDETTSLLDDSEQEKFQFLVNDLQKNSTPLFPFTLLNEQLSELAQADDVIGFKKRIISFVFKRERIESLLFVFPFKDACLSQEQWQQCENVLISEFPEKAYIKDPSQETFETTSHFVQKALQEINHISPDYFSEIEALVSNIVITRSNRFIAGSSFTLLGLVALADNHDFNMIIEYLVHETAHQYLYNLTVFDELCSGEGLHTSPLRKDPRPVEGIYHAVFVLARIIDFYHKALQTKTKIPKGFMEKQIAHYQIRYKDAYDLLVEKATLTDLGRDLLESSKSLAL